MAIKSTVFVSTNITNTNSDRLKNSVTNISFTHDSGDLPPNGAVLSSVQISFSKLNVYSSQSPELLTQYGDIPLSQSTGSQSSYISDPDDSILGFAGGTISFTVYANTNGNVLNFKDGCVATLTINWESRTASTGTLDKSSCAWNGVIKLTISAADTSFTHEVIWKRSDSYYSTQQIQAGQTVASFTVPSSWPVGSATVSIKTYLSGEQIGSTLTYNWTVTVDESTVYPTAGTLSCALVQPSNVPSGWKVFVQNYSKAKLTLSGYSAGTSASISKIDLSLGSLSQSGSSAVFNTEAITETGELEPKAEVTNSFGNTTKTVASKITVHPYSPPKIESITAFRCLSNGVPNDYGTYISVKANVTISSVSNMNDIVTLQAQYRKQGATSWSSAINLENNALTIIAANMAADGSKYEIRIVAIDSIQNLSGTATTRTSLVLTSECVLFFRDGGLNVSVGTQGTRDNAIEINESWEIWQGDRQLNGIVPIEYGGTGANSVRSARNALGLGDTAGALPIANGGTGQTSVASARNALGLGNTSGAVPIANGGTGSTSAANARSALGITPANIGSAPSSHEHGAGSITSGTLSEYRLPFKIRYGSVSISGVKWSSVSFSGFSSTPIIVVSYADNSTSGMNPLKTQSESAYGFEVCMSGSSGSGTRTVNWIAIGT